MRRTAGWILAICLATLNPMCVTAVDGTWLNTSADGTWADASNWVGGIIPGDGGTAVVTNTGKTITIDLAQSSDVELSGMSFFGPTDLNATSINFTRSGEGKFVISADSVLNNIRGRISFAANILSNTSSRIVFTGPGRTELIAPQKLSGQVYLRNGWIRIVNDSSLGKVPETYIPDAVVLDGGTLQNGRAGTESFVTTNRGITVTAAGGYLMAGYQGGLPGLGILSPITGPGALGVNYEFSPVRLYNPLNSWTGDTVVGSCGPGASPGMTAILAIGADHVIPHGEGKGVLRVAPLASYGNQYMDYHGEVKVSGAILNLEGHRQEVNAVYGNPRSTLSSSVAGGTLVLGGTEDSDWRGTVDASVTIEKTGTGTLRLHASSFNGTLALSNGVTEVGGANVSPTGRILLDGGTLRFVSPAGLRFWSTYTETSEPVYRGYAHYPEYGREVTLDTAGIKRAVYTGVWNVPEDGVYSFRKNLSGAVSLKIDGETILSGTSTTDYERINNVTVSAGAHRIELSFSRSGTEALTGGFPCGIVYDPGNGSFERDEERNRSRMFADDGSRDVVAAGGFDVFTGTLNVKSDTTVLVDNPIETFVFGGILTTSAENPATITFDISDGKPFVLGGTSIQAPAVFDAPINCANGFSLTNHVWLRREMPAGVALSPGVSLTFDYAGAPSGSETLSDYSLHLIDDRPGETITVPAGKTLTLDTMSLTEDGFTDPTNAVRRFTVNVVLDGGELLFTGAGTLDFAGTVSGVGSIRKTGTGDIFFTNGSGLLSGTTLSIESGRFYLASGADVGASQVILAGGRLMPLQGSSITFPENVSFQLKSGGFETSMAEETITVTGPMSRVSGAVSTWGPGTVRIAGTSNNNVQIFVRDGSTLTLANTADSYAVGMLTCCSGSVVRLEGPKQVAKSGSLSLSGGILDMNGNDLCVTDLIIGEDWIPGIVTNSATTPSVLTTLSAKTNTWLGTFAGPVKVQMGGTGISDLSSVTLNNIGLSVTNGMASYRGSSFVSCNLLRFTVTKTRPGKTGASEYAASGCQLSDLFLYLEGTKLTWPEGTTAHAAFPSTTSAENASKVIDGSSSTKWYTGTREIVPLTIDVTGVISFDAYAFRTANDAIGRDPVSWTLEAGRIANGVTNWFLIDEQTDLTNRVPTARFTMTGEFSVSDTIYTSMTPESYNINVTEPGILGMSHVMQRFDALTGTGTLIGTNGASFVLGGATSFAGKIVSSDPVSLVFNSAVIPGIVPASGTRLVNNGSEGSVTYSQDAFIGGTFADGSAPLGLTIAGGAVNLSGTSGGWTGPTTIASGSELSVSDNFCARYFRFTVLNCTGNKGMNNAQLSELRLLYNGKEIPWPSGTTASSIGTAAYKDEGAAQLIDGRIDTKCYWGSATDPVLITAPESIAFDGYDWYSANDSISVRQPVSWRFEISMDGITWTEIDAPVDAPTGSVGTQSLSYSWENPRLSEAARENDSLSDVSSYTIAADGKLTLSHVDETFGPLFGAGTVLLRNKTRARVATKIPATFTGAITGEGSFIKEGPAEQLLSGTIACGELVVEDGILNLTGASLEGVTNIVLRGGAVIGEATATGDLTVTFAGGAYGAGLTGLDRLTLTALEGVQPKLLTGFAGEPLHGTCFTFASTDDDSRALFLTLIAQEAIPFGWTLNVKVGSQTMGYTVLRGGAMIILR